MKVCIACRCIDECFVQLQKLPDVEALGVGQTVHMVHLSVPYPLALVPMVLHITAACPVQPAGHGPAWPQVAAAPLSNEPLPPPACERRLPVWPQAAPVLPVVLAEQCLHRPGDTAGVIGLLHCCLQLLTQEESGL
jgi:hypothetical protein